MSVIKETRGSIMIAALIVTLITGSLVGLFLKTVTLEVENSYRSRMAYQAINLAEAGIDYAIDAFIQDDWTNWTSGGDGYYRKTFIKLTSPIEINGLLGTNEDYEVIVYAQPGDPMDPDNLPQVVAEGTVSLKNGITVSRQILVKLKNGTSDDPTKGGFWGNGILGKRGLTFGGNKQTVDSFSSSDNTLGDIGAIYNAQVSTTILGHKLANGNGSVASNSTTIADISVGNADIFGSLATGSGEDGVNLSKMIGPSGSIYNEETLKGDSTLSNGIDTTYITYDFYANIPDVTNPTLTDPETTLTGSQIGEPGVTTSYEFVGFNLDQKNTDPPLMIEGDVIMFVDGDLNVKGEILLAENATLELYVSGDITIGGTGIMNTGRPPNLLIFNTGTDTTIKLHGNGALSGAVYAPNSAVELKGGGGSGVMYGAVVGDTVVFAGNNYDFHYDEDLADMGVGNEDNTTGEFIPEVSQWVELTDASDRKNMATILTDGL